MATAQRRGFETRIELDQFAMDIMIEALDADDNVLGRSEIVTTKFPTKLQPATHFADLEQEVDSSQDVVGDSDTAQDVENHLEPEPEDSLPMADHELSRPQNGHSHLIIAISGVCVGCICVLLFLWVFRRLKWMPGQLLGRSRMRYERLKQHEAEYE
jgi:hypothetical protein